MMIVCHRQCHLLHVGILIWLLIPWQFVGCVTYKIPLVYSGGGVTSRVFENLETRVKVLREISLRGKPGQGYYISVNIGNPPQMLNVLVDTGSSNFAVATAPDSVINTYFQPNKSRTFKYLDTTVFVPYTQGNWEGSLGVDEVSFPTAPSISVNANVACIKKSDKFFINGSNWQGILGLAYPAIARPTSSVAPFFDTLVNTRNVSNVFSLHLCSHNDIDNLSSGMMTIGGIDSKLYFGNITYAPLRREWYYEITLTQLSIDDIPLEIECQDLNSDKTIVDSGTTNLRLPKKVFLKLVEAFKQRVVLEEMQDVEQLDKFWLGESVMCWTFGNTPWSLFPPLQISVAHTWNTAFTLVIPPQQYLREVEEVFMVPRNRSCYKFAINPSDTGTVLGTVIMEGFYLIFDRKNKRIGFAKSTCLYDDETSNSKILGPFSFIDAFHCGDTLSNSDDNRTLMIVAYVMAGLCGICLIPLIIMTHRWFLNLLTHKRIDHNHCYQNDTASLVEAD